MRAAMRCKLHPYANAGGVCAPCLRHRLLALAAERDQAAAASDDTSCGSSPPARRHQQRDEATTRGFPSSVSPYVAARRRSDACVASSAHQPGLPFRTPQVGPAAGGYRTGDAPAVEESHRKVVRRRRSFLAAIFGRRRGREEEGAGAKKEKDPPRRSASWLSAIVRRKRRPDVSLRPAALPEEEEPPESPGSSSSTTSWWFPSPSPARQHPRRRHGTSGGDGMSGFAVCLSPLARPSSAGGRRRCQPPDPSSFSLGDSHRRHASASFGRNTSRKLVDMSRFRWRCRRPILFVLLD
jgi:hypothetical protein